MLYYFIDESNMYLLLGVLIKDEIMHDAFDDQ